MTLVTLVNELYHIVAVCRERGSGQIDCALFDLLYDKGVTDPVARKMLARLRQAARLGRPTTNTEVSKPLGDGIYEFRKDNLRIIYFFDDTRMIICTHHFIKKTQKTPPGEKDHAKLCRANYLADKSRNITIKSELP